VWEIANVQETLVLFFSQLKSQVQNRRTQACGFPRRNLNCKLDSSLNFFRRRASRRSSRSTSRRTCCRRPWASSRARDQSYSSWL